MHIIVVYGSPYEEGQFFYINWQGPTIVGDDFNLVRYHRDKSNENVDIKWCENFNEWVGIWHFIEIHLSGRQFTWANNQDNLVLSKIDIIFCSTEIDKIFPLANAKALPRIGSDHAPILWDSGEDHPPRKASFKFEKWWLDREDFKKVVIKAWSIKNTGRNAIDNWQS